MNKVFKGGTARRLSLLLAVFVVIGFAGTTLAKEIKIDLEALTNETQRVSTEGDKMTLIWWIPEEYWRASFAQDPSITKTQAEELVDILRPYTLILAVDGNIGKMGGITYKPEETIRAAISLKDEKGNTYRPYSEDKISPDAKNFLAIMKPIFANMLGSFGENMHFFLFPSKNGGTQNIALAKMEGGFTVKMGEREFKWRLPLGSVLPSNTCPVDGEKLSGAWKYCPWHGVKLNK